MTLDCYKGFPCNSAGKESACNVGDLGLILWIGKIPWRRERLPTLVFWPGEFYGLYSPWDRKESDTTFTFFINDYLLILLVSLICLLSKVLVGGEECITLLSAWPPAILPGVGLVHASAICCKDLRNYA